MTLFSDTSLNRRLYMSFACMWAIMIFFAFFRGEQLRTVMHRYNDAINTITIRHQFIGDICTALTRLRLAHLALSNLHDSVVLNTTEYKEDLMMHLSLFREYILTDRFLTESQREEQISIVDSICHNLNYQYLPTIKRAISAFENGNSEEFEEALATASAVGDYISELVWELRNKTLAFAEYITETMAEYDVVEGFIFNIATIIGISIAILLAVLLARAIQNPISKLKFALNKVTSGDMNYSIRMESNDDFGKLSNDIADMVESISDMIKSDVEQKSRIEQQKLYEAKLKYAAEKALAASKAKSTFLANMSHEIRTPMNSVLGYSELALDGEISEETREYLEKIVINAKWLLNIINNILDVSKIESGNLVLEEIPFDINKLLVHCRSLVQPASDIKGLALNFHVSQNIKDMKKRLLGDPTKLSQIFVNILSNAIKFTESGTVVLSANQIAQTDETTPSQDELCTIKFEVSDTGIGMTDEQVARIFEPFVQADESTSRKYGGTGLGLPITKRLIDAMNSELFVESIPGAGTKFFFTMIFKTVEPDANSSGSYLEEAAEISKPYFDEGDVLVVDDNNMNLGVACEHLKRVGLKPFIAKNGKEAIEIVKKRMDNGEKPFDLIFMDIHMPEMDGKEAASIINAWNTGVPIIAMTAETMELKDEAPYKEFGMAASLSKPFTAHKLWKCLLKYLKPVDKGEN